MRLYKELARESKNNIANLELEIGLIILVCGYIALICSIFFTILCWNEILIIPLIIGEIVFSITYVISLKLLIQAKQLEYASLTYLLQLEQSSQLLEIKGEIIEVNEQLELTNNNLVKINGTLNYNSRKRNNNMNKIKNSTH